MRSTWKRSGLVLGFLLIGMTGFLLISGDDTMSVDAEAPWHVVNAHDLVSDSEDDFIISMSPKGTWLYGYSYAKPFGSSICIWRADTSERTCIETDSGESLNYSAVAWSPDETSIVIPVSNEEDEAKGQTRLLMVETSTGSTSTLVRSQSVSSYHAVTWSPDSRHVAFFHITDAGPITLTRIDHTGNNSRDIVSATPKLTLEDATDLKWTADNRLVFRSGQSLTDAQGYWRVDADGSNLKLITAVTPKELDADVVDVSPDGQLAIFPATADSDECGPDFFKPSYVIVDVERDEIVQVICAVYQHHTADFRAIHVNPRVRAVVTPPPYFLPDGTVIMMVEQRSGDRDKTGLAVLDVESGQLKILSNDLPHDTKLSAVSTELDDGTIRLWLGGLKRQLTLAPEPEE